MTDTTATTGPAGSTTPKPMGVRDVLRIPDFRSLFIGQAVSDIGDGITLLLVLLVINDLTGSTAALAVMAIAEAVPAFTVGLFAGVYVDRWDRRRIMLVSDLLRAGIVLSFGFVQTPALLPLMYVLGFTQASVATFFRPARAALLPHIMPAEGLPAANSLAQASMVIGGVIGAGLAGLIFSAFGSGLIGFGIDAMTFLISFVFILTISREAGRIDGVSDAAARAKSNVGGAMLEGLAIIRGSRVLAGTLLAAATTMLGLGAVNVLFVPLLVRDLQVNPAWMAGIDLAQTVGMILAAGAVAWLVQRLAPTTIITLCLAGLGVLIGVLAGVSEVWQVIIILFGAGLMVTPLQAMLQTIVQTSGTDATRGRIVSLLQASLSTASVASMAIGGVLGDVIGIRMVFLGAAGVVVVAAGVAFLMFRGEAGRAKVAPSVRAPEAT
jgi:MFS transporter, DHA3 family, macrolide efflux protein